MRMLPDSVFLRVAKLFGLQDIAVPAPDVDERFVVRASNASVMNSLVLSPTFREPLLAVARARVDLTGVRRRLRRVPGVSELRCRLSGRVRDMERLRLLVRLTRGGLDVVARKGVASAWRDDAP